MWIGIVLIVAFVVYAIAFISFAFYVNNPSTHNATPLNKEVSNQYHIQDGKIIYVLGGNFFSLGGTEIQGADPDSFEVIDQSYAKDSNYVYYDGKKIVDIPPDSVELVASELTASGANSGYIIIGGKVFCYGGVIEGADPESFTYILGAYAMDKHYIYHYTDMKMPRKAVPVAISNASDGYIQHGEEILYEGKIISHQATSFEIIDDEYSKDSSHLFSHGAILTGMDPESFTILSPYYRKDKNQAYYFNNPILGSDPTTFKWLNDAISKDKVNLYYNDHLIKNKQPSEISQSDADDLANWSKWRPLHLDETTVIMAPSDEVENITYQFFAYNNEVYAADKKLEGIKPNDVIIFDDDDKIFTQIGNKIFYMGVPILNADPDTFSVISDNFSKDSQHVYWTEHKVIDANPLTFKYENNLYADENESGEYILTKSTESIFD